MDLSEFPFDFSQILLAVVVILICLLITLHISTRSSNQANNADITRSLLSSPRPVANFNSFQNSVVEASINQTAPDMPDGVSNVNLATKSRTTGSVIQTITPSGSKTNEKKMKECYPILTDKDGKKGICLILNYFKYPSTLDKEGNLVDMNRYGTEKDANDLETLFHFMDFIVKKEDDLQKEQTIKKLKEVAAMDHSEYTCFILCILAHGVPGHICIGTDLLSYKAINDIFEFGNGGSASKSLAEKPKLFFIQACQGERLDTGRILPQVLVDRYLREADTQSEEGDFDAEAAVNDAELSNPVIYQTLITGSAFRIICSRSHRFTFTSSYSSYQSIRMRDTGTWFIQDLVTVFKEQARNTDLDGLCLQVKQLVSERTGVEERVENGAGEVAFHFIKQMPEVKTTLQKAFRFY